MASQHSYNQRRFLIVVLVIAALILGSFRLSAPASHSSTLDKQSSKMAQVKHIVLFQFKSSASPEAVQDIVDRMLSLKDGCKLQESGQPYIIEMHGGIDNSPEGAAAGLTHAFIVGFESLKDRDYYVHDDPVHQDFKSRAGKVLEKAQVIDYSVGVF